MNCLLFIITVMSGQTIPFNIVFGIELTYEDIEAINGSCMPQDTCMISRYADTPGFTFNQSCTCERVCSKLGTCCIDSYHLNNLSPSSKPRCRRLMEEPVGFYMVDRCSGDGESISVWKSLCEQEWKGEDNIMKLAPVTSLYSTLTYKNYFCLRCYETTNEFVYWDVELGSDYDVFGDEGHLGRKDFTVTYDRYRESWMAIGRNYVRGPVKLKFRIPTNISSFAVECDPDMISNCANSWTNDDIRQKCEAYMGMLFIRRDNRTLRYKNAHCAFCNFEEMNENLYCTTLNIEEEPVSRHESLFTHLIEVNRYDRGKMGKLMKCKKNFVWDPYAKKCRRLFCPFPGYVVEDERCIASLYSYFSWLSSFLNYFSDENVSPVTEHKFSCESAQIQL